MLKSLWTKISPSHKCSSSIAVTLVTQSKSQNGTGMWNAVMATWRENSILEEKKPKLEIVVEEVDVTSMTEKVKTNNRWSDADSQRTLLPF